MLSIAVFCLVFFSLAVLSLPRTEPAVAAEVIAVTLAALSAAVVAHEVAS